MHSAPCTQDERAFVSDRIPGGGLCTGIVVGDTCDNLISDILDDLDALDADGFSCRCN